MGLLITVLVVMGYFWFYQMVGSTALLLPIVLVALCIFLPKPFFRFLGYGIGYTIRLIMRAHKHQHTITHTQEDDLSYEQGYQATIPSLEMKHRLISDFATHRPSYDELPQAQYPQQPPI